jgi:hypothetical protein
MPLPTKWDENEIFIIILSVLLSIIAIKMLPKRLPYTTSILIFLFNISMGIAVDHVLAGPPLDLYDVLDTRKFELFDLILYFFVYGPYLYIVMFCYDKWFSKKSKRMKFIFLFFIALLNVGLEFIAAKLDVFLYKGWNLFYSFLVYFLAYFLNICLFHLLKKHSKGR